MTTRPCRVAATQRSSAQGAQRGRERSLEQHRGAHLHVLAGFADFRPVDVFVMLDLAEVDSRKGGLLLLDCAPPVAGVDLQGGVLFSLTCLSDSTALCVVHSFAAGVGRQRQSYHRGVSPRPYIPSRVASRCMASTMRCPDARGCTYSCGGGYALAPRAPPVRRLPCCTILLASRWQQHTTLPHLVSAQSCGRCRCHATEGRPCTTGAAVDTANAAVHADPRPPLRKSAYV